MIRATGNETLATRLEHISGRTLRARIWCGQVDANAAERNLAEHEAIYLALVARDAPVAQAAALMHLTTTERWLREHVRVSPRLPSSSPSVGGPSEKPCAPAR